MSCENDIICFTKTKKSFFVLTTENGKLIQTEDQLSYVGFDKTLTELVKITPPRPIWDNGRNSNSVQCGVVLIGGNGLNS
jgi:hypothetical protein